MLASPSKEAFQAKLSIQQMPASSVVENCAKAKEQQPLALYRQLRLGGMAPCLIAAHILQQGVAEARKWEHKDGMCLFCLEFEYGHVPSFWLLF